MSDNFETKQEVLKSRIEGIRKDATINRVSASANFGIATLGASGLALNLVMASGGRPSTVGVVGSLAGLALNGGYGLNCGFNSIRLSNQADQLENAQVSADLAQAPEQIEQTQ